MKDLIASGERLKIARVLGVPLDAVDYLRVLGVDDLRELRRRISAALYGRHESLFRRTAGPSRILPAALTALLARKVFGPMLAARICGQMPPARAVDVAAHLPAEFMADVCLALDPRRADAVLHAMPASVIVDVARVLVARREFIVMAQFVDELKDDAIRAVAERVLDDEALIRVALYVEHPDRLDELIDLLPEKRLLSIIDKAATGAPDLQAASLGMMERLTPQRQGHLGDLAVRGGPETLTAFIEAARREDAAGVVRGVMTHVSDAGRRGFVDMLASMDPALLARWAAATTQAGLWPTALALLAKSEASLQASAAAGLRRLDAAKLHPAAAAAKADARLESLGAVGDLLRSL